MTLYLTSVVNRRGTLECSGLAVAVGCNKWHGWRYRGLRHTPTHPGFGLPVWGTVVHDAGNYVCLMNTKVMSSLATSLIASLLCVAVACGSSGGGGDPNARFSCTSTTSDGISCTDYSGGAVSAGARNSCTQSGGTITEGALCPADGVGGICSFSEGGGTSRVVYYNLGTGDIPILETGCTDAGGTWSTH
jgi:hypothetical protein